MPYCTPKPFTVLVANPNFSSVRLQHVVGSDGTLRQGGPMATIPVPSAGAKTASIQVVSARYWDPTVAAPGPFYTQEEIQAAEVYLGAGMEFGSGLGSLTGPEATIATQMAASLSFIPGLAAVAVGDTVYITSRRPDATLPLSASNDTRVLLGGTIFTLAGSANEAVTLSTAYRRTYYLTKAVRSQTAPVLT